jgi:hypothetical protein
VSSTSRPGFSLTLLLCAVSVCRGVTDDRAGSEETQRLLTAGDREQRTSAFGKASFLSRLTFAWMDPLLRLGYSKPLDFGDIPPLDADDAAEEASRKFLEKWHRRRQTTDAGRTSCLVFLVLAECYKKELLLTALYTLLRTLSFAASPLILYCFVSYSYQQERSLAAGLALIVGLVLVKLVESLSQRHWFFGSRRLGMRMRSALMAAVFEKQLSLSSDARRRHSAGEVANYIAVDAYRLGEFPFWLHLAWCMPLQARPRHRAALLDRRWRRATGPCPRRRLRRSQRPFGQDVAELPVQVHAGAGRAAARHGGGAQSHEGRQAALMGGQVQGDGAATARRRGPVALRDTGQKGLRQRAVLDVADGHLGGDVRRDGRAP